jgi:hypothetical protein
MRVQLAPSTRQTNPVYTVSFTVFKINFSIILPPTSRFSKWSFPSGATDKILYILLLPVTHATCPPISSSLFFIVLQTSGNQYEPRSSPSRSFAQLLRSTLFSNISDYEIYMFLMCAVRNSYTYVTNHNRTLIKYHTMYTQYKCALIKYMFYQCAFVGLSHECKYRSRRLYLNFAHQAENSPSLLPVTYITV